MHCVRYLIVDSHFEFVKHQRFGFVSGVCGNETWQSCYSVCCTESFHAGDCSQEFYLSSKENTFFTSNTIFSILCFLGFSLAPNSFYSGFSRHIITVNQTPIYKKGQVVVPQFCVLEITLHALLIPCNYILYQCETMFTGVHGHSRVQHFNPDLTVVRFNKITLVKIRVWLWFQLNLTAIKRLLKDCVLYSV